jgi:hypothetical protein
LLSKLELNWEGRSAAKEQLAMAQGGGVIHHTGNREKEGDGYLQRGKKDIQMLPFLCASTVVVSTSDHKSATIAVADLGGSRQVWGQNFETTPMFA